MKAIVSVNVPFPSWNLLQSEIIIAIFIMVSPPGMHPLILGTMPVLDIFVTFNITHGRTLRNIY